MAHTGRTQFRLFPSAIRFVIWLSLFFVASACFASESASVPFVQQLRSRQLFTLAERHCFDVLKSASLSDEDRILITIELAKTFVEHASGLPAEEADDFYGRANDAFNRLLERPNLKNASWVINREQLRTLAIKAGHRLRDVVERPLDTEAVQLAVEIANSVEKQISIQCDRWTNSSAVTSAGNATGAFVFNKFSRNEAVASLEIERVKNRILLARLVQLSGKDVSQQLDQTIDILRQLRSSASAQQKWDIGLLLVEIYQLAGDLEVSKQLLKRLNRNDLPADYQNRLAALQVKHLLASDKIPDAAQYLIKYRQQRGQLRNELSYLKVKSTIELWQVARKHQNLELADQLWQQVTTQVQRDEMQSTLFWRAKSQREWKYHDDVAQFGEAIAQLKRDAQTLHAANRIDDAISTYAALVGTSQKMEFDSLASESSHIQASLLYKQEKYEMAIEALEGIEKTSTNDQRLAESEMLRVYCLAKLYESDSTPGRLQAYVGRLKRYRQQFETHQNYADATWLLSRVEINGQRWVAACELLTELIDNQNYSARARLAFVQCLAEIQKELGGEFSLIVDGKSLTFVQVLKRLVDEDNDDTDGKNRLSVDQQNVSAEVTKLMLASPMPDYGWAVQQSTRLLNLLEQSNNKTLSDDVAVINGLMARRLAARQLQIVALIGDGQFQNAEIAVKRLAENNPRDSLDLLMRLSESSGKLPVEAKAKFVQFQLTTARHIDREREDLSKDELLLLDRVLVNAYEAAGQVQKALTIYRQLLKQLPNDTQLAKKFAVLLIECGTDQCLREAHVHWMAIEKKSQKGSHDWIDARYHMILCRYRLKKFKDAQKLMRLTELLHPDCFEGKSKERFGLLKMQIKDALPGSTNNSN